MITIGPFLSRWTGETLCCPEAESTGYALEFASSQRAAHIPVYRRKGGDPKRLSLIPDYLFHAQDTPFFKVTCPKRTVLETRSGMFLRLESLLAALYGEHAVARSVTSFLAELRDNLPFDERGLSPKGKPRVAFREEITQMGF